MTSFGHSSFFHLRSAVVITFIFVILNVILSCATSMMPVEVLNQLPKQTKSKLVKETDAEELLIIKKAKYLVKDRHYAAPMGLTVRDDLKNAAKGIDQWVQLDGGNAYVLKNYKWVAVGDDGGTQLQIDFHTLLVQ